MLSRSSGLAAAQSVQMIELSLIFVVAGKEEGGSWNLPSSMRGGRGGGGVIKTALYALRGITWSRKCLAWISCDYFESLLLPQKRLNRLAVNAVQWRHSLPENRVVILIGWLSKHSHTLCIIMKNFSGIVAWYSADRIPCILSFSSNISISFNNLYLKQQNCPCLRNWNAKLNCKWRIIAESR